MREGYIYRILAPGSNSVYVGQSYNPHARFKQHKAKPCNPALARFLKKHPDAEIYFWPVLDMDAGEIEDEAECRALGYNLLNCIPCGSAPPVRKRGSKMDETFRAKMRAACARRPIDKGLNNRKGFNHTVETRAKMSLASKGIPKSVEHRASMRSKSHGPNSVETRAKKSAALLGKPWTAARRAAQQRMITHAR